MKNKLIVRAINLNEANRGSQLYLMSADTLSFVQKIGTNVRGQRFEEVAEVVKTMHVTKTVTTANGKRYKWLDDMSVREIAS